MALEVEDGTGKANAESPNSVAELNTYHSLWSHAAWTGTEAIKEAAAREGSVWLEGTFGHLLDGDRKSAAQALSFPRVGASYRDGRAVPEGVVVNAWKFAHAEAALLALQGKLIASYDRGGEVKSESLDGVVSIEYAEDAPVQPVHVSVEQHLWPLIYGPVGGAATSSKRSEPTFPALRAVAAYR